MANIVQDFLDAIGDGLEPLLRDTVADFLDTARADVMTFIEESKAALERWLNALAQGIITAEDFAQLVRNQQALMRMEALKQAGLAATRLERLRTAVIDLVIRAAFSVVPV